MLLQKNKNTNKNEQKNLHQIYKLRVQSSALVFYLPWKASSSAMQQPVIMLGVFFIELDETVTSHQVQAHGPESADYSMSAS